MQIEIKIDSSCAEPKIIIFTAAITEEVNKLMDKLSKETPQVISGSKNEKIEVIEQGFGQSLRKCRQGICCYG